MSTGKVIVLKDMGNTDFDVSSEVMNQMAKDLNATIIHLPVKYDLAQLSIKDLKNLKQDIEAEIKRMELLKKLQESKV